MGLLLRVMGLLLKFFLVKTGTGCKRFSAIRSSCTTYFFLQFWKVLILDSRIPGSALSYWRANFIVQYESFYAGRKEVAQCVILDTS